MQVRRWSPFHNAGFAAQWSGNRASVCAWNEDEVKREISDAGLDERRCVVCPESFLRAPLQDGARIINAVDGFEGQVWQEGFLAFSRWWPRQPGRVEWDMFQRAAGLTPEPAVAVPEPVQIPFLETPWHRQDGYLGLSWTLLEDPRYAAALATLVAAPLLYMGAEFVTLTVAQAHIGGQLETLSAETQGIRKMRTEALSNLDEIEDSLALEVYPSQFEILTTALGLMESLKVRITEWTYDVGQLAFTFKSEQSVDPTFLITAFEKNGSFTNVTASRVQDNQLRVRMDVIPRQSKPASASR